MAKPTPPAKLTLVPAGVQEPRLKNGDIDPVLECLFERRNFDFRSYKRATLARRIERRMVARKCGTVAEYVDILSREPEEVQTLLASMLIKVTSFFRDSEIWAHMSATILPALLATKRDDELRVWCAGCATGEEAFTVAILIAEALGQAFNRYRLKIFATDLDEGAIATARRGVFPESAIAHLPPDLIARWFVRAPEGWAVRTEIRRVVVFGVNNLVSDAPISRLDLITCRNVFIYLDSELQKRVLARFHYALRQDGVLLLGKSELIPYASKIFQPVTLPFRIYRKEGSTAPAASERRLSELLENENSRRQVPEDSADEDPGNALHEFYRDALDALHLPVIVTSQDGGVNLWNRAAARLWNRREPDVIGKKLASLEIPGLPGELLVEKSVRVRTGQSPHEVATGVLEIAARGTPTHLRIHVYPLRLSQRELGLVYVVEDVTEASAAEEDHETAKQEARKAKEVVRAWSAEQQSFTEELETTNEELQSANEELQTTNEELQSTNEELETTNGELQSTNSELDTTNRELASRTQQINLLSTFQRAIIRSVSGAVIVLDPHGRITAWNLAAERLLGIAEDEALGQSLWTLHVPALPRQTIARIRRSIAERKPLRASEVRITLPGGGAGSATIAAVPLTDNETHIGAVVLLEGVAIAAPRRPRAKRSKKAKRR